MKKRHVSTHRQPWLRTAVYSFMTIVVTVIVAVLMLIVLGFQFNKEDGKIEQGGLLQFQSIPTGATVTIDQRRFGSQTNTKATVESGHHYVTYNLDKYRQWQKSITVTPGQVGWLSYARMIPSTITPVSQRTYVNITGSLAASNNKYMLLHEEGNSPSFTLADIQNDSVKYSTLTLPQSVYTATTPGKGEEFILESWSVDDGAILIRHVYDDTSVEWLLLDRDSPEKSVNITKEFGVSPEKLFFAGNGHKFLFAQVEKSVRRMSLDEQTISRPLVSNVDVFYPYDEKTIIFSTLGDEKNQRFVGYAATDIAEPVKIKSYPADGVPLIAEMTNYFSQNYVAIVHGKSLEVLRGNLPTLTNKGTLKRFTLKTLPDGPFAISVSSSARFFVVQVADGYATYDLELQKYDTTKWKVPTVSQRPIQWLDGFMIWSDNGGELRFYDFDGANQQNIMPSIEGSAASLNPNGKFIYSIAKSDKGFEFQRAQLILQ